MFISVPPHLALSQVMQRVDINMGLSGSERAFAMKMYSQRID